MGARMMSAFIEIGGAIPADLVDDLCATIRGNATAWHATLKRETPDSPVVGDWNGNPFEATTADELLALLEDGTLKLYDGEAKYGEFEEIEAYCQKHEIAFDRHTEGAWDQDPEIVYFRPGMSTPLVVYTDTSGYRTAVAERVRDAIAIAERNEISASDRLRLVVEQLRASLGPDVPDLEPLTIVGLATAAS